jgi:hypothetical protein
MWQKKVLNRPVSPRDGTDPAVIADMTLRERLRPRNNDPLEQIDAIDELIEVSDVPCCIYV